MLAKVEEALKDKGRKVKDKSAYVMEALRRDYNIMKFADKILINAEPHSDIKGSKGITQNQTELGIQLKKDVYFLNKKEFIKNDSKSIHPPGVTPRCCI